MILQPFDSESLSVWLIDLERRRRVWWFVEVLARLLAGTATVVGVLIATDVAFSLPSVVRIVTTIVVLAVAIVRLAVATMQCLRRVDPVASACAIEWHRPVLDERLITLAGHSATFNPTIERQLRAGVAAVLVAEPIHVAWHTRRTAVWVMLSFSVVAGVVVAVVGMGWSSQAIRVLMPWSAAVAPNARLVLSTSVASSRDRSPVTVEADYQNTGDEPVVLHVTDASGEASIAMVPQGQNRFVRTLSQLLQSVDVYATAGDVRSRSMHITVVTPATRQPELFAPTQ